MAERIRRPTIVGVFDACDAAEQTLIALHRAGFRYDEIGLVHCSGEVIEQEDALATADVADRGLLPVLLEMGVPESEARACEHEFEVQHAIVTVHPADRAEEATAILGRFGARTAVGAASKGEAL